MPIVSVHIRKNDLEEWKTIPNKSEWLHYQLKDYSHNPGKHLGDTRDSFKDAPYIADFKPALPDSEKGYPCCSKRTPCKHWTFNGQDETWVNTITGEVKELQ